MDMMRTVLIKRWILLGREAVGFLEVPPSTEVRQGITNMEDDSLGLAELLETNVCTPGFEKGVLKWTSDSIEGTSF